MSKLIFTAKTEIWRYNIEIENLLTNPIPSESIALLSKNVNSCSRKRLHAFDSAQNFSKIHANYLEISYFDSYFDFFYRFQTPKKHDYDIFSRIKSFQARHGGLIFQFLLKSCVSKSARHADLCFLYMCDHIPIQIEWILVKKQSEHGGISEISKTLVFEIFLIREFWWSRWILIFWFIFWFLRRYRAPKKIR